MVSLSKNLLEEVYNRYEDLDLPKKSTRTEKMVVDKSRVDVMLKNTIETPQDAYERIRGTNNLTSISFLLRGYEVSKSVGLLYDLTKDEDNSAVGTAFLIGPNLILTNHHVLSTRDQLSQYAFRLDFERDLNGLVKESVVFKLVESTLFYSNEQLDFTIIEVSKMDVTQKHNLTDFGYLPLFETEGKITENEFCTLIQHPQGRPKQIALFENEILHDKHPDFLLYSSDTVFGSSGSPVLNYDWVVVGLHHAGVPVSIQSIEGEQVEENDFPREANEGIRISSIYKQLKKDRVDLYYLLKDFSSVELNKTLPKISSYFRGNAFENNLQIEDRFPLNNSATTIAQKDSMNNLIQNNMKKDNIIRFSVPLEISLGTFAPQLVQQENIVSSTSTQTMEDLESNLFGRNGYNPDFLDAIHIDLEKMFRPFKTKGLIAKTNEQHDQLAYTNFSVVMHKIRRMCLVAAVNINGGKHQSIKRGNDRWYLDSRISKEHQLDNSIYVNNDLDRGHMVRREDPNWGPDATTANNDTFHYTNACPQHKDLNQKDWLKLEDYVLKNTKNNELKISVFTGPILDDNYKLYREALVPVQFYKIVAMIKSDNTPSVTGYVLSQLSLLSGLEKFQTSFEFGKFKTYQLPLLKIQEMTGLDLEDLLEYDPLSRELESIPKEIQSDLDLIL